MARIDVSVEKLLRDGTQDITVGTAATDDGLMFSNDGSAFIALTNNGAGVHNITFVTPQVVLGLAVADEGPHALAAGETQLFGPFPPKTFNQKSGADRGKIYIDTDGTDTELEGRAFKL